MKDVLDTASGIRYLEITSRKTGHKRTAADTIGQGLLIVIGFMSMAILMLAVA